MGQEELHHQPQRPSSLDSSHSRKHESSDESNHAANHDKDLENSETVAPVRSKKADDPFLAKWEENDPNDPYNWPLSKKIWLTAQLGILAFIASLASAITSPAQQAIRAYTGVGETVAVLPISLYVLGFVFGPCVWGPASEIWGRKWTLSIAMFGLGAFSIGVATSQNFASIAITRFFSGVFGSGPVANVSAALGDVFRPKARGIAVSFYAVIVVGGPLLGPRKSRQNGIIGALLTGCTVIGTAMVINPHMGWRWVG